MLAMLDSPNPRLVPEGIENSVERLAYLLSGEVSIPVKSEDLQNLKPDEQLMHILKKGGIVNRMFSNVALPQLQRFQQIVATNMQALRSYAPEPYAGPVVFFEARERDAFTVASPHRAWSDFARGGMTLHEVPGNHITMSLPPNVEVLVEHLTPHLVEAQALT
jgi:thioesterase domain-containing protein